MAVSDHDHPPPRSQAQRRADTQERLLAAGIELFAEQGFPRTTLAQIGERAGYSRETVRLYFGTKLALLEAAIENRYEVELLAPTRDRTLSGLDQVLGCTEALATFAREDPTYLQVVCMVNLESLGSAREYRRHSAAFLEQAGIALTGAFTRGIADGSVRADADAEDEAANWVATAIGVLFRWMEDPTRDMTPSCRAWQRRTVRAAASEPRLR